MAAGSLNLAIKESSVDAWADSSSLVAEDSSANAALVWITSEIWFTPISASFMVAAWFSEMTLTSLEESATVLMPSTTV